MKHISSVWLAIAAASLLFCACDESVSGHTDNDGSDPFEYNQGGDDDGNQGEVDDPEENKNEDGKDDDKDGDKDKPSEPPEKECTETVCGEDNDLHECNDGILNIKTCPFGCENGACLSDPNEEPGNECTETVCDGDVLKTCKNGYIIENVCQYGCENEECREPACTETVCDSDGRTLLTCDNGVVAKSECTNKCEAGACVDEPECTQSECSDDSTLKSCEDGKYNIQNCPFGCDNGACKPAECTEDKCRDGKILNVCVNGKISEKACDIACEKDACKAPECTKNVCKDDKILNECSNGIIKDKTCSYRCVSGECWDSPVVSLDKKKIMFTGNSLTYYGEVVVGSAGSKQTSSVFYKIAKFVEKDADIKVTNFTYGSAGHKKGRSKNSTDNMPDSYNSYGIFQLMKEKHPCSYNNRNKVVKLAKKSVDCSKKKDCEKCVDGWDQDFYDQDYVFLQQRRPSVDLKDTDAKAGTSADENTYEHAIDIAKRFPPKTQFVVMQTSYASTLAPKVDKLYNSCKAERCYKNVNQLYRIRKLYYDLGWRFVPWGSLVNHVFLNKYSELKTYRTYKREDFIITKDQLHPNYLTGYITALMAYAAITNRSVAGFSHDFVMSHFFPAGKDDTLTKAMNKNWYSKKSETAFAAILKKAAEIKAIQARMDKELITLDNKLRWVKDSKIHYFGNFKAKNPEAMTDAAHEYKKDDASTFASFNWIDSADKAKNWTTAPHFDANGNQKADGKYLGGFYYEIPTNNNTTKDSLNNEIKAETINRFRLYNPSTTMEIDGFDILTSMDAKTWKVVYSGSHLACGLKYQKVSSGNVNKMEATFAPTKARYVMFALTEPRCQHATADDIKKYNEKYGTSVKEQNKAPQTLELVELEVYRYTERM